MASCISCEHGVKSLQICGDPNGMLTIWFCEHPQRVALPFWVGESGKPDGQCPLKGKLHEDVGTVGIGG